MKDYADQQRRMQADIRVCLERNQQLALDREEEERQQLEARALAQAVARETAQEVIQSAAQEVVKSRAVSALEVSITNNSHIADLLRGLTGVELRVEKHIETRTLQCYFIQSQCLSNMNHFCADAVCTTLSKPPAATP